MQIVKAFVGSLRIVGLACAFISDILAFAAVLGAAMVLVAAGFTALTHRRVSRGALAFPRQLARAGLILGGLGLVDRVADPSWRVSMLGFSTGELAFLLVGVALVLAASSLLARLSAPQKPDSSRGRLVDLGQRTRGKRL